MSTTRQQSAALAAVLAKLPEPGRRLKIPTAVECYARALGVQVQDLSTPALNPEECRAMRFSQCWEVL